MKTFKQFIIEDFGEQEYQSSTHSVKRLEKSIEKDTLMDVNVQSKIYKRAVNNISRNSQDSATWMKIVKELFKNPKINANIKQGIRDQFPTIL